jgi:UDP-glucose 4-epimerase
MTVLITGGAGYVGAHVVRGVVETGRPVLVLDDLSTGEAARVEGVEVRRLDVEASSSDELAEIMTSRDVGAVIHLAGRRTARRGSDVADQFRRDNVTATARLIGGMSKVGVGRITFASTAAVHAVRDENDSPGTALAAGLHHYGRSKLESEGLLTPVYAAEGFSVALLRIFNIIGTGHPSLLDRSTAAVLPSISRSLRESVPFVINGDRYPTPDGTCVRDFVDVRDVAAALLAADFRLSGDRAQLLVADIGSGTGTSVRDVVRQVSEHTGRAIPVRVGRPRRGDVPVSIARIGAAQAHIGWRPRLPFGSSFRDWASAAISA